jgi:hypothetical protein
VSRAGDRCALGAGDLAGEPVGDLVDVVHVLVAGDDERRRCHVTQPRGSRRIELSAADLMSPLSLEGDALHVGDERAHVRVDVLCEPQLQVRFDSRVEVAALERCVFLGAEGAHFLRPLVSVEAGADEDERRHAVGRLQRELERDPPAERRADERDRLVGQAVAHERPVVDDVRLGRAVAEAGQVECARRGERLELLPVHPRVGDACVQQDALSRHPQRAEAPTWRRRIEVPRALPVAPS